MAHGHIYFWMYCILARTLGTDPLSSLGWSAFVPNNRSIRKDARTPAPRRRRLQVSVVLQAMCVRGQVCNIAIKSCFANSYHTSQQLSRFLTGRMCANEHWCQYFGLTWLKIRADFAHFSSFFLTSITDSQEERKERRGSKKKWHRPWVDHATGEALH